MGNRKSHGRIIVAVKTTPILNASGAQNGDVIKSTQHMRARRIFTTSGARLGKSKNTFRHFFDLPDPLVGKKALGHAI
jgi:hypothetical protein